MRIWVRGVRSFSWLSSVHTTGNFLERRERGGGGVIVALHYFSIILSFSCMRVLQTFMLCMLDTKYFV
jgi:hypothetical protein